MGTLLRAFRSRNYRLFFVGQSISLVGTGMQQVAVGWLLYRLTHNAFLLGAAGFASQIPSFLMAPVAGVLADRWDRKRMLQATQVVCFFQALALGVLVVMGSIKAWQILGLSAVLGVATAFEVTLRHSFMPDLVEDREALGNAIALNSTMVNLAKLVGPVAAGVVISLVGEGQCFLLNAVSFVPVIGSLAAVRVSPKRRPSTTRNALASLKEGLDYTFRFAPIRTLVVFLSLVAFLGMPHTVLMPIFAKEILRGGPQSLGFLAGASGLGALVGSLYLVARRRVVGLGRVMVFATTVFGGGLLLLSVSRSLHLSLVAMAAVGFGLMVHLAAGNTLAQAVLDDDKRGRVMSFFVMAFVGVTPLGSLLAGALADWVGAPVVVGVGGAACIAGAAWFASRRTAIGAIVRPIYARAGVGSEETVFGLIPTDEANSKERP